MWKAYLFLRTLYTAARCYWADFRSNERITNDMEGKSEGEQIIEQELKSGFVVFTILS